MKPQSFTSKPPIRSKSIPPLRKRSPRAAARHWLNAALAHLSPNDRAVITLVELEDFSMEEAARELGCGLSAVKVRAFRARRRLKVILEEIRAKKETTS